ncbi:uncharacterized protein LOC119675254 [Teleopsis dalmanni]|uniref:uncharacterized protein LOC119675254 n=1 Tax=Teleopsis dalmanni TaxID=139649 RepID=UPI0018CFAAE0|nr:uncharacterized protein LOC119675254 [Teleopsis dalmanni]
MSTLQEKKTLLENKLEALQEQVGFCLYKYDYHHQNNEENILKKECNLLIAVKDSTQYLLKEYNILSSKIIEANNKCNEVEKLLVSMGLMASTTKEVGASKESQEYD